MGNLELSSNKLKVLFSNKVQFKLKFDWKPKSFMPRAPREEKLVKEGEVLFEGDLERYQMLTLELKR